MYDIGLLIVFQLVRNDFANNVLFNVLAIFDFFIKRVLTFFILAMNVFACSLCARVVKRPNSL